MNEKYIIFRHTIQGWNAIRLNIASLEIAERMYNDIKAENGQHKLKIIKVTEEVVREDLE